MADFVPIHPLGDPEAVSKASSNAGVTFDIPPDLSMVQVFARKGQEDNVIRKLGISDSPRTASSQKSFNALPLSPGQWMLVGNEKDSSKFEAAIAKKVAGIGYVSQQSASRVCFRVSGPKVRDFMSRGCRLDLGESVTSKGYCAQTPIAQIGVLLHQIDEAPTYDLYVYSGFARAFWHWLTETAAQFR